MTEPVSEQPPSQFDIVIIGGGIAGLWLLNRLSALGYNTILLERESLGHGQSIASQGIIHGGLKYALGGAVTGAANAIAGMPRHWRDCLTGVGEVDLRQCEVLSEDYYMWSEGSYRSRIKTFLGSKSLQGRIHSPPRSAYPEVFSDGNMHGRLYQMTDFVINAPSLLATLANNYKDRVFKIPSDDMKFVTDNDGRLEFLELQQGTDVQRIASRLFLFSAGEGNFELLNRLGRNTPRMQTRPLNMVIIRSKYLPQLFVHCIGNSFSLSPTLTVTTHKCNNGETAWYLGGELAETGVKLSDSQQIENARILVSRLFPAVKFEQARWCCLRINRAEAEFENKHRPDSVYAKLLQNVMVVWPTKFTLSPALGNEVIKILEDQQIEPKASQTTRVSSLNLPAPSVAAPPWETLFENA